MKQSPTSILLEEVSPQEGERESAMSLEPTQLHAMLDDELSLLDLRHIQHRLQHPSDDERALVDELEELNQWTQQSFRELAPPSPPDTRGAWLALQARMTPEVAPPSPPRPHIGAWLEGLSNWLQQWAPVSMATAAVALLLLFPLESPKPLTPSSSAPRAPRSVTLPLYKHKGGPFRMLHARQQLDTPELSYRPAQMTRAYETLYPGDLVQFLYRLDAPLHVMVVSLNKKGEVFAFVPLRGEKSIKLGPGKGTLPHKNSLVLDKYIGPERFFMVASKRPFTLSRLRRDLVRQWESQQHHLDHWPTFQDPWHVVQTLLIHKQPLADQDPAPTRTQVGTRKEAATP